MGENDRCDLPLGWSCLADLIARKDWMYNWYFLDLYPGKPDGVLEGMTGTEHHCPLPPPRPREKG